jgi:hypothetical protein
MQNRNLRASLLALLLASSVVAPSFAQVAGPVGQTAGGGIDPTTFSNNSDPAGFNPASLTPAAVALATSTAQATFTRGSVATGQVLTTKSTVITTCSSTTGFTLPAVQRYEPISVMNRSGGSCLIWPSLGGTVETALGTNGAANAAFTMLTNTDVTFRPIVTPAATNWLQ